jgi:hypothetical protein
VHPRWTAASRHAEDWATVTERIDTPDRSHRGRRLAVALALSGAVAAGLTACQVQPGAAAFVGSDRITQSQVETVSKSVSDLVPTGVREQVVQLLVVRDLARRVAREQGVATGPVNYREYARYLRQYVRVSASNAFTRLYAETYTALNKLAASVTPVAPGETEYREIYRTLSTDGLSYSAVRSLVDATPHVDRTVGLQHALNAAAKKYRVTLNPRYGTPIFYLPTVSAGGYTGFLPVRLGKGSKDLVVAPSPTASPVGG